MSEPTIGEVRLFAGNFAPRGWMFCAGQLLSISQYEPLYALLGTTYGGDGQTTFALPDLRGRAAAGTGQGPGLPNMPLGQAEGITSEIMTIQNMPMHNHLLHASSTAGDSPSPEGRFPALLNDPNDPTLTNNGYASAPDVNMNANAIGLTGGNTPFSIVQPFLGLNFIIAVEGLFPSRN
jgi:microcystin-dependent protein